MEEHDAVWAETTDGGLLKQLFGYYPTMHDARVRRVDIDRKADTVEMSLHYFDEVESSPSSGDLHVLIALIWTGVRTLELTLIDNDLMSMNMVRKGDLIRTEFLFSSGTEGAIESERFEARLEKLDPLLDKEETYRVTLGYR